jgi:carboxyl-terminal processing protease
MINSRLLFLLFLAIPLWVSGQSASSAEKLEALLYHIDRMYVDTIDEGDLVEKAIRGMLEELDPHSIYIPKEEVQRVNEPLKGNFDGIGVQFNILRDSIFVVFAIPGGPSEKLGIRAGDRIVKIEGEPVSGIGITNREVMDLLRGTKGTRVNVSIARYPYRELLDFTITRNKIPIRSIEASYMATPDIGYIKVRRFSANTMKDMRVEMAILKEKGMKHMILDLQGNGGGYLRTAINMADEFLTNEQLIVYQEGKSTPRDDTYATSMGTFEKGKVAILIDESSASASEIVAGAIQDWDRGVIVGRRSFGKGLVQRPVMLPDGSAVRLTVSRYFTPSGRCIQKPYEDGFKEYAREKYDRLESGELTNKDSLSINNDMKFFTKKKNRTVFGGGGIVPDIFVPLDTNVTSEHYGKMVRKGVMNSFALSYVDANRKALLAKYPDVTSFNRNFSIDENIEELFKQAGEQEGVIRDEVGYEKAKELMHLRLKALMARDLWNTTAYFQVINPSNPLDRSYQVAVRALNEDTSEWIDTDSLD